MAYVVAIDGTAGSGKGTVTKMVANKLNMINIDTGIIYRSITLDIINNNIDISNLERVRDILDNLDLDIKYEDNNLVAILNKVDVTKYIRTNEVNNLVSKVSSIKIVRDKANDIIRNLAKKYMDNGMSIIMEGRDITTVVFPDALVKIYMDASLDERAKRRYLQNKELGIDSNIEDIKENLRIRDYDDMHKEYGALIRTDDSIYLDTTNLNIDEVTDKVLDIINNKLERELL